MKYLCSISLVLVAVLLSGCENQGSGNAEKREAARRERAREQEITDQSQANLIRAQQNVNNRDGSSTRY
jgi:hypothetical protein